MINPVDLSTDEHPDLAVSPFLLVGQKIWYQKSQAYNII